MTRHSDPARLRNMSIIVIADTHGNTSGAIEAIERETEATAVIHLGDCADDGDILYYSCNIPMIRVAGNCDNSSDLPREIIVALEGCRTLITHGHLYGVKKGLDLLVSRASQEACDLVLYGHTHNAEVAKYNGILFVNPGTLKEDVEILSYARLTVDNGRLDATIVNL